MDHEHRNGDGPPRARWPDGNADEIDIVYPPRREGQQAIVGVDPMLEEFERAPFDPLYAARVGGRLTGEVIRRPPRAGWMRALAILLALFLLSGGITGLVLQASPNDPYGLALSAMFTLAGVVLGWRLLRRGGAG